MTTSNHTEQYPFTTEAVPSLAELDWVQIKLQENGGKKYSSPQRALVIYLTFKLPGHQCDIESDQ